MADEEIAIKIQIESERAKMSLGDLEKGFDGLQEKLKAQDRSTKEGREEFKRLATQMAQTSGEIKNMELAFEGLDREQIAGELGSVAGGIGDITASLVLMGGENETIEQIGASIEKAMAISMGFKGAIEGLSSASKLYNNIVRQGTVATIAKSVAEKAAAAGMWLLTTAQAAFNLVAGMNPIALVVMAVTALIAGIVLLAMNIDKVVKYTLLPFQFILRALGLMEESTAEQTKKAEAEKEKATREAVKSRIKELKKLETANRALTDNLVADKDFEIAKLKAAGKDTTKLEREKLVILQNSYIEQKRLQEARLLLIDEEIERNGFFNSALNGDTEEKLELHKELKKSEKDLFDTSRALEIFDIEVKTSNSAKRKEIHKKEVDDKKKIDEKAAADAEKAAADAIALEKEKNQLLEDLEAKAIQDKNVRALAELELAQERERAALIEKYGKDTELMKALETEQMLQMDTLIEGIEQEARDKKAEIRQLELDAQKEADDKEIERLRQQAEDKQKIREQSLAASIQVIESISSINDMALQNDLKNAGNNEAKKEQLRKESFEREKKLNIAMALVNGAQAQMSILAQTPKADFGIATAIAMAAAAVTTIAQIAAIKATSYQGGGSPASSESAPSAGGAGAAGGGAAISPVSNTSTILGNQQVFVTETDITDTQNNVSVIEESATF